jgi:MATE family multidrug resistance protein
MIKLVARSESDSKVDLLNYIFLFDRVMNRKILDLAIPNIISSISVPLIGIVDMALMGRMPSADYIGGVALGSLILNFVYWGFGFLRFGTSGFTSQSLGRRDLEGSFHVLVRAVSLGLVSGLILILLQVPLSWVGFRILNGEPNVENLAEIYFRIKIWAAPASLIQFAMFGWFIGMQNSKIPMTVSVIANIVNVLASIFFVTIMKLDVRGVAIGYVIGQYTGLTIITFFYFRYFSKLGRYWNLRVSLNWLKMKEFMNMNKDIFIRTMCLIFVFSFFTGVSASADAKTNGKDTILAVNSILMQFFMFFSFVIDGFAQAAEAMAGKFIGAADNQRLKILIKYSFYWGFAFSLLFTITYFFAGGSIFRLLTDNSSIISNAKPYFYWITIIPIVSFAAFLWDGIYIGATAGKAMRNSMLISTILVFFPVYFILRIYIGNHSLWLAFILFMISRTLTLWVMAPSAIYKPGRVILPRK